MSEAIYETELLEYRREDTFATVRVIPLAGGWASEWWLSRRFPKNVEVAVLGMFLIPVFGDDLDSVERRIRLMSDEVIDFSEWAYGGTAGVQVSSSELTRLHAQKHMAEHRDALAITSATERTAVLYSLAVQFGVNNPAALIARVEVLPSVRTVHDRLAHARRIRLLDSPGKGKVGR
jgi:hypothetical protein